MLLRSPHRRRLLLRLTNPPSSNSLRFPRWNHPHQILIKSHSCRTLICPTLHHGCIYPSLEKHATQSLSLYTIDKSSKTRSILFHISRGRVEKMELTASYWCHRCTPFVRAWSEQIVVPPTETTDSWRQSPPHSHRRIAPIPSPPPPCK